MIPVMMRVENIFYWLGGDFLGVGDGGARATGKVGIDDDEIVLHLDDDVIAMPFMHEVAFAEPDTGHDLFEAVRLSIAAGEQVAEAEQDEEAGSQVSTVEYHKLRAIIWQRRTKRRHPRESVLRRPRRTLRIGFEPGPLVRIRT